VTPRQPVSGSYCLLDQNRYPLPVPISIPGSESELWLRRTKVILPTGGDSVSKFVPRCIEVCSAVYWSKARNTCYV